MKRDTVVAILVVFVITAAVVAFVWWRSTQSLMKSAPERDGGLQPAAMVVAHGS